MDPFELPRPAEFSASIVTFDADLRLLGACLDHLEAALRPLSGVRARVYVVDNGPARSSALLADWLRGRAGRSPHLDCRSISGQGNVGFGRGHNLAIAQTDSDIHLVLNPDAELAPDALAEGLRCFERDPKVVLVAAWTAGTDGRMQSLCKTYPSVLVLALRALGWTIFSGRLRAYDVQPSEGPWTDVTGQLVSGSFMLCRTSALKSVGGFDPDFFLYFEDFDLSLRLAAKGRLVWSRDVRIRHHGGGAARKGWRHRAWFIRSASLFFSRHGWRWC